MAAPNPTLSRIEGKLDTVSDNVAKLTTQVAVLADHVARQNGRVAKTEEACQEHAKALSELRESLRHLADMERRAWQAVIGLSMTITAAVIGVIVGLLTGQLHVGGVP